MHPPDLCRYSPFPGNTSPSVELPAPSNRKPARAMTTDCSLEKSLYSSGADDDDDDDCYRTDGNNGGDIYSVVF